MRQTAGQVHFAPLSEAGQIVSARLAAIVTDSNVAPLYLDVLSSSLLSAGTMVQSIVLPAGEGIKTEKYLFGLYDKLSAFGVSREDAVIALGGGAVGDLAGFAAATYLRGVAFFNCPTTLLSMCDSAIGGKTGIDLPSGKNLVGAFHMPKAVIADADTLSTLPEIELSSGTAEVIKCACIADASLLEAVFARNYPEMVRRAAKIKQKYVALDPLDHGVRRALNFGHTVGHAIEACSGYATPHGHAVAMGMAAMSKIGERMGVTERGTAARLTEILRAAGLPCDLPAYGLDELISFISHDKKAADGEISAVLLKNIGEACIVKLPIAALKKEIGGLLP